MLHTYIYTYIYTYIHTYIHTYTHSIQPYTSSVRGFSGVSQLLVNIFYLSLVWLFWYQTCLFSRSFLFSCLLNYYFCVFLKVWSRGRFKTIQGGRKLYENVPCACMCKIFDYVHFMCSMMTKNHIRGQKWCLSSETLEWLPWCLRFYMFCLLTTEMTL